MEFRSARRKLCEVLGEEVAVGKIRIIIRIIPRLPKKYKKFCKHSVIV